MAADLETRVLDRLRKQGGALAVVESCTGGRVAARITSVPGSSETFWGSIVAYDNSAKIGVVGVQGLLIEKQGAVSAPVAEAMAQGGLEMMRKALAHPSAGIRPKKFVCVSTTGIAGPGGGTREKPVGSCWIGVASDGRPPRSRELREDKKLPRAQLQEAFVDAALKFVLEELEEIS